MTDKREVMPSESDDSLVAADNQPLRVTPQHVATVGDLLSDDVLDEIAKWWPEEKS